MPRVYTDTAAPYAGEGFDFERYDEIQRNPLVPPEEALQIAHEQELAGEGMNRVYATSQDNAYTAELRQRVMEEALQKQQAETMARRYKGQRTYQSLIEGGATAAEAFRLAGADLNATSPVGEFRDVPGGRLLQQGPQSVRFVPNVVPKETTPRNPIIPPEVKAKQDILLKQIAALRKPSLMESTMGVENPTLAEARNKQIAELERQYVANVSPQTAEAILSPPVLETVTKAGLEANKGKGGIEMTRQPKAQSEKEQAELVVTTRAEWDALPSGAKYTGKDGRKYRKP